MKTVKQFVLGMVAIAGLALFSGSVSAQTIAPWMRIEQLASIDTINNLQISLSFTVNGVRRSPAEGSACTAVKQCFTHCATLT